MNYGNSPEFGDTFSTQPVLDMRQELGNLPGPAGRGVLGMGGLRPEKQLQPKGNYPSTGDTQ